MQISASELASLVNGQVEGNPDVILERPCRIEEGFSGGVTFLGNPKYEPYLYTTQASAVLIPCDLDLRKPVQACLIRVENVYASVAVLLQHFDQGDFLPEGISEHAFIHPEAELAEGVSVGPFAVIEAGARIGSGTSVGAQAYVGHQTVIGQGVRIFPGARILHDCVVGNNCTIQSNAVIGSEGFGYALGNDNQYERIPQLGNVVLEEDVDIGACTTIDRASLGSTLIQRGSKLDNLVQIAHNVQIGAYTAMAAQSGIAGSTKIGSGVQMGGQSGIAGHLNIADGVRLQAQSGVASNIEEKGQAVFGTPSLPIQSYLRSYVHFKKLPELSGGEQKLEKKLDSLSKGERQA